MTHNYNLNTKLNIQRTEKIIEMCKKRPTDVFEMSDTLNMSVDALRAFMRKMVENKTLYISDYYIRNATWVRRYSFGNCDSVDINAYIKCNDEARAKRRVRTEKARDDRIKAKITRGIDPFKTKEQLKLEKKVMQCKSRPRKQQEIKPDIASAWMFNPC